MSNLVQILVGAVTAAALALSGWALAATVDTKEKVAVQSERVDNLKEQLQSMDRKLDRLIDNVIPSPRRRSDDRRSEGP